MQQEGTYLAWLDFRGFDLKHDKLLDLIVNEARVGLMDGSRYGKDGRNYVRLNFGCPRSILKIALEKLQLTFTDL